MSFAYVQSAAVTGSGSSSLAFSSGVTSGNVLVAFVGSNGHQGATITDSKSNTWVQIMQVGLLAGWICFSAAAGSTTVSASGLTGANDNLIIAEYSVESPLCYIPIFGADFTARRFPHIPQMVVNADALVVLGVYDFQNAPTWGTDNSTLRQHTVEADNASLALGDAVFVGGITSSQTCGLTGPAAAGTSSWGIYFIFYKGTPTGGAGPFTVQGTDGGCNG